MDPKKISSKLVSIRANVKRGEKTKAINRLQGLINFYPNVVAYRELLGDIYYGVDWCEKAGRYWLLTDLREPRHKQCVEIFKGSLGNSSLAILNKVKFRGEESSLPTVARQEYEALKADCVVRFGRAPHFKRLTQVRKDRAVAGILEEQASAWSGVVLVFSILLFLLLAILGLGVALRWLFGLF